jgi:hypothetical protein
MASTPTTAAPPDHNSCRPLRPNGSNTSIEASLMPATARPTWISAGRELVRPLKVAAAKIDTTGSAHPRSTRGGGRRALASNGISAMRPLPTNRCRAAGHRQGQSIRNMIRGSSPPWLDQIRKFGSIKQGRISSLNWLCGLSCIFRASDHKFEGLNFTTRMMPTTRSWTASQAGTWGASRLPAEGAERRTNG